jgi:hypothetical protein
MNRLSEIDLDKPISTQGLNEPLHSVRFFLQNFKNGNDENNQGKSKIDKNLNSRNGFGGFNRPKDSSTLSTLLYS